MRFLLLASLLFSFAAPARPKVPVEAQRFYRDMILQIRDQGSFRVPMPNGDLPFSYKFEWSDPIYQLPVVNDTSVDMDHPKLFWREFWDRIGLKDGSYALINGEQVPLTCVVVQGQDNRYAGRASPLIPEFILTVYLVANDYTCQGPIRPGWPQTGGRKENWDTYIKYEVRDPTIMLPVDPLLRYRWSEFNGYLVN
jgi:hypothetical protein